MRLKLVVCHAAAAMRRRCHEEGAQPLSTFSKLERDALLPPLPRRAPRWRQAQVVVRARRRVLPYLYAIKLRPSSARRGF